MRSLEELHGLSTYLYRGSERRRYAFIQRDQWSSENLIKWAGIIEATVPNLVHSFCRLHLIASDLWPDHHASRCPPPHAFLQLLCDLPLIALEELVCPSTLATQRRCADLSASLMPHVEPVNLEAHMVVCMYHLVCNSILHVLLVEEVVRADHDPVVLVESANSALLDITATTSYLRGI